MTDAQLMSVVSPSGKVVVIDDVVYEAMEFAKHHEHITPTKEEDRAVKRKLDMIVMPLFSFLFMLQFWTRHVSVLLRLWIFNRIII
ncbi:protein DAL5 [Kluyveromyces marxianus]|uniref:Protein DAL5 n=1 Tax=Kluyveromyces marxianus TaxID=4911 RepID=A0ABX6EYI5_KLUMA|nr:protein DAL5 [Kluyveromyces marxianus]